MPKAKTPLNIALFASIQPEFHQTFLLSIRISFSPEIEATFSVLTSLVLALHSSFLPSVLDFFSNQVEKCRKGNLISIAQSRSSRIFDGIATPVQHFPVGGTHPHLWDNIGSSFPGWNRGKHIIIVTT